MKSLRLVCLISYLFLLAVLILISKSAQSASAPTPAATVPIEPNSCTIPQFIDISNANEQDDPATDGRYIVWSEFVNPFGPELPAVLDLGPDGIFGTPDDGGKSYLQTPYAANYTLRIDNGRIVWRAGNSYPFFEAILTCTMPACITNPPTTLLTAPPQLNSIFVDVDVYQNRIAYIQRVGGPSTKIGIYDLTNNTNTIIFQGGFSNSIDLEGDLIAWQHFPYTGYKSDILVYNLLTNQTINITGSPNETDLLPKLSQYPSNDIYLLGFTKNNNYAAYTFIINGVPLSLNIIPNAAGIGDVEIKSPADLRISTMTYNSGSIPVLKKASPPYAAGINWTDYLVPLPNLPSPLVWGTYGGIISHGDTVILNQLLLNGYTKLSISQCP